MTYTLLVLLAALLAKGRVQGGAGWARALLAAGLTLSPQLGATSILLLSPDHTGTAPYRWESDLASYDPARHYANFVVTDGPGSWAGMPPSVPLTFGQPARTYHVDGFTVQVWNTNVLAKLDEPA